MKPTPRLAASLLVLLAALVLPSRALATPQPGINVSAYADAVPALNDGAKQVRFFVPWKNFEPDGPGQFTAQGPSTAGSLTTDLKVNVDRVRDRGATPMLVLLDAPDWASGGGTTHKHPRSAAEFAAFAGELASWLRRDGKPAPVYEVWNEPDAEQFWGGTPDPDFYVSMLRAADVAIKGADPSATVLAGPTTGSNFHWIEGLYARGAKGTFDGVAVHTDTACSIVGPDQFYREADGRLGQFTFLGYREVRKVMLANGDDKPIYMSEIGWATTNRTCTSGASAGKKKAGVSEADQAAFLTHGFRCMANDPYLVAATWFSFRDDGAGASADEHHYGLLRSSGSAKPALAAFKTAGAQSAGACGDFAAPSIRVVSPSEGEQFVDKLDLRASAADRGGVGVARITYAFDGGKPIRNFTDALHDNGAVGLAPWQGSGALGLGPHTIEVIALDANGNTSRRTVNVVKVAPGSLASTLTPVFKLATRPSCAKRGGVVTCAFKGSLTRGPAGGPSPGGKVSVEWLWKNKQHRFRKLAGGLKPASKPFRFTAAMKKKGTWRVRVSYVGQAPYKSVASRSVTFKVR